jgi:hypothetical protein
LTGEVRKMAALGMAALGLDVLPPAPPTAAAGGEPAIDLEGPWNTYEVKIQAATRPRPPRVCGQ